MQKSIGKTIAQKIFKAHLQDTPCKDVNVLSIDRVFCHEITTPMAIQDLVQGVKIEFFIQIKSKLSLTM